jgi:YaiO family outer membrane protein
VSPKLLAVALLAGTVPALAAQAPPESGQSLYDRGVEARLAGDHARAIEWLRSAAAAEPANADARLQLGLALMAADRLDEAEAAFRETLRLAPAYDDARIGLARLARRRGDVAAARAELERVNAANGEAAALRAELGQGDPGSPRLPSPWQIDLDASYSAVGSGASDWREGSVQLRRQASESTAIAVRIEHSRRFGLDDTYGEARLDRRLAGGGNFYLSVGATPDADFRPRWQAGAGIAARVRGGPSATVLTLDARQARYRSGDIQTLSPGIEQYFGGGRFWATGRLINIFDEAGRHRLGWLGRGDAQLREDLRIYAGLADAPDTSEGVVVDTFSLFGGLSWDVSRRVTLRLSAAREDRESGPDRVQLGTGLGLRF